MISSIARLRLSAIAAFPPPPNWGPKGWGVDDPDSSTAERFRGFAVSGSPASARSEPNGALARSLVSRTNGASPRGRLRYANRLQSVFRLRPFESWNRLARDGVLIV